MWSWQMGLKIKKVFEKSGSIIWKKVIDVVE